MAQPHKPTEFCLQFAFAIIRSCHHESSFSREWYANAQCDWLFRRRPLSGAFTHPSCMVYPPGEPEPEPEPEPVPEPAEDRVWERPTYTIEAFENPSK